MKRPMIFEEIRRSFDSEAELNQFLADNPTYKVSMLYGNHGINAVIIDVRMADVSHTAEGLKINKWL